MRHAFYLRVLLALLLGVLMGAAPAMAQTATCPAGLDVEPCNPVSADVCTSSGGDTITCDLSRAGLSPGYAPIAFFVSYDDEQFMAYGKDNDGHAFCCDGDELDSLEDSSVDPWTVTIYGTAYHDEIRLTDVLFSYVLSNSTATVWADDAADTIYGSDDDTCDETLNGEDGTDTIRGLDGDDTINGGAENDQLYGGAGEDTINGGDGDDDIAGGDDDDTISGGDGNDDINGDDGSDTINGDANNDCIWGGLPDSDTMNGGAGTNDTCEKEGSTLPTGCSYQAMGACW